MPRTGFNGLQACVTGAAGFIGSHLAAELAARGAKVLALDSLAYGSWDNIDARQRASMRRVRRDLAGMSLPSMLRTLRGCTHLFHFAAEKHNNSAGSPQRVIDVNVSATQRLFEAAGRVGMKKVVFASSLYAYGRLAGPPMRETDPAAPRTVYGASKLAGEGLLRAAAVRWGFRHQALRFFFVYGPRQHCGTGYPSVIVRNFRRILAGERPVVHGTGGQVLDYVHVRDAVRAVLAATARESGSDVLNVASGRGASVRSLTAAMLRVSGARMSPLFDEPDWTEGTRRVGDIRRTVRALDWRPSVPLERGLASVWAWLRDGR